MLPCALAAFLAGVGWREAYLVHHRAPFFIVISVARWLAKMMLLKVTHFMREGLHVLLQACAFHLIWVDADFIGGISLNVCAVPNLGVKMPAIAALGSLHDKQARHQPAIKKPLIEKIIGALKGGIKLKGWLWAVFGGVGHGL